MHSTIKRCAAAGLLSLLPLTLQADAITDLLDATGLSALLSGSAASIDADALNPTGTGDNDTLGIDLSNPENILGATLASTELLGIGSTGAGPLIPLDFLGLQQLITTLGLTHDSPLVDALRNTVGPDGALIVPITDSIESLSNLGNTLSTDLSGAITLPGLDNQALGLAIAGEDSSGNSTPDGLAGVALLTPGASGNGGLIGLAVLSGGNSGNGDLIGISILGGDNSGNGDLTGVAVLGGDNAGNSQTLSLAALSGSNTGNAGVAGIGVANDSSSGNGGFAGVGVLNDDNTGNGGTAGVGALNGDNAGNGDTAGVSVINGDNSGNSSVAGVAALSGANSGNSNGITAGALNGANSSEGGVGSISVATDSDDGGDNTDNGGDCEGLACGDDSREVLALTQCAEGDADGDGICDERDECPDTPANTLVYVTGCHLDADNPLILKGVNFEFDSTQITPASEPLLQRARDVIADSGDLLISIDGHTDSKGSDAYNNQLSSRRANAIMAYFTDSGIDAERLVSRGFGESKPIAANTADDGSDNPAGRAENRRVELVIVTPEAFAQIQSDKAAREQAAREAAEQRAAARAAEAARQKEQEEEKAEQRARAEAAEDDYQNVLQFLEETGSADTDEEPSESQDLDEETLDSDGY